jgi:hypothetical protein
MQARTSGFLFIFSAIARMTGMYHHTQILHLRGNLTNFLPGLVWNCHLPDLSLCVAEITRVNYCVQLLIEMRPHNFLSRLISNHDPLYLSLPSS